MAEARLEDIREYVQKVAEATAARKLSQSAQQHIDLWLKDPGYADYLPELKRHIDQGRWSELDAVFWTVIPFGTGGRRGKMYPIGTNAINDRTIAESAQGLAEYVHQVREQRPSSCVIAYDTRHRSSDFARLCAEVMAAAGFRIYFLDGYRSTPELSFAVRHFKCACGIMVTASHNPPSDNAVKVYWSHGGQLLPPHDEGVIRQVMNVRQIQRVPFDQALARGDIIFAQEEADRAFVEAVLRQSRPGPRDLRVLYSPLHGVGAWAVCPVLERAGFRQVEVFQPHAEPSGEFPNVPKNIANPENPEVFVPLIARAQEAGLDIALATDPDCDRLGCAVPESLSPQARWRTLSGNQIGVLFTDYLLRRSRAEGTLNDRSYVVKTMVTTELITKIASDYGVAVVGDLPVGFKWIGGVMESRGADGFILGAEESYGFLIGTHARDKDAAVAALVLCEMAAELKESRKTLYQYLVEIFRKFGWYWEKTISYDLPGKAGMELMQMLMSSFRAKPPGELGKLTLSQVRDFSTGVIRQLDGTERPFEGPRADVLFFDLEKPGNCVAVRPSGTEPKVKFYFFAAEPPSSFHKPDEAEQALTVRLAEMEASIRREVESRIGPS